MAAHLPSIGCDASRRMRPKARHIALARRRRISRRPTPTPLTIPSQGATIIRWVNNRHSNTIATHNPSALHPSRVYSGIPRGEEEAAGGGGVLELQEGQVGGVHLVERALVQMDQVATITSGLASTNASRTNDQHTCCHGVV